MSMNSSLPSGWMETKLADVSELIFGQSPPSDTYSNEKIGLPFFQGKSEFGTIYPTPVKWCVKPLKIAKAHDIIISVRAPVGPTNLVFEDCCIGRGLAAIRPKINLLYVQYWLKYTEQGLAAQGTGTTFNAITKDVLSNHKILIAPLNEQERIISKIEELFNSLDKAESSLKNTQKLLEQYKQSVLKAAVTGELTREWREQHPVELDSGEELLSLLIPDEIRKQSGCYKKTDDNNKFLNWNYIELGELIKKIESGKSFRCKETPPENGQVGVVKVSAVTWGFFDETQSKTITDPSRINHLYRIQEQDFLFSRANTRELVGASVIVEKTNKFLMLSDKILRFNFHHNHLLVKKWVNIFLKSKEGREQIENFSSGNQASMRNISQGNIKRIQIPFPRTFGELSDGVNLYEVHQSKIDELKNRISITLKNIIYLRQSILKSAFSGQLTFQDPNDEPAEELLNKINVEKHLKQPIKSITKNINISQEICR